MRNYLFSHEQTCEISSAYSSKDKINLKVIRAYPPPLQITQDLQISFMATGSLSSGSLTNTGSQRYFIQLRATNGNCRYLYSNLELEGVPRHSHSTNSRSAAQYTSLHTSLKGSHSWSSLEQQDTQGHNDRSHGGNCIRELKR